MPSREVDADDAHAFDQRLIQHLAGAPTAPQQDVGAFHDFLPEPIVEVVVHLLGQFVVRQGAQIQIVFARIGFTRIGFTSFGFNVVIYHRVISITESRRTKSRRM